MTELISTPLIRRIKPNEKAFEIRDERVKGFILRVERSGIMTYYVEYGRGKRLKIGPESDLKPDEARTEARKILAAAHKGEDPKATARKRSNSTLGKFLDTEYKKWADENLRHGDVTRGRLKRNFKAFLKQPINAITFHKIDKWRNVRLRNGINPSTVNRDVNDLRGALSRALAYEILEEHPLKGLKPIDIDGQPARRYLNDDEIARLRKALDEREGRMRDERRSGNMWRQERQAAKTHKEEKRYALLKSLDDVTFVDHLKPMVLLSLNTGMRKGEVFSLRWENVSLDNSILTVAGSDSKSGNTRHIALNSEAIDVLKNWNSQTKGKRGLVFKSLKGKKFDNVGTSWANVLEIADITNFRWHDLRHTFASRLVQKSVDLNIVRELLGHSDYKTTLLYSSGYA